MNGYICPSVDVERDGHLLKVGRCEEEQVRQQGGRRGGRTARQQAKVTVSGITSEFYCPSTAPRRRYCQDYYYRGP